MEKLRILQSKILAGLLILLLYSCQDKEWDKVYVKPDYLKDGSIMDVLAGPSDYREFSGLLRKTGYDSLLRRNNKFTVFAVKNGSFSAIDTISDLVALKKIIGMHILPVEVLFDKMGSNLYLSVSGKPLRFVVKNGTGTVNKINIVPSVEKQVLNGVVHEVESVIMPLKNIYEFILSDPDFDVLHSYIDSSFTKVGDITKNLIIGYDTLGKPIYKPPIIYKQSSPFMNLTEIDSEKVLSTVFVPSASALNNAFSRMLAAREGNVNLIIPRLNKKHGDTTISYYFIPKNTAYIGDTAVLLDTLFKNNVIKGEVSGFAGGINNFKNYIGTNLAIDQSTIVTDSTKYASNGYIYTLNDITLPDVAYRRSFIFLTRPKIPDPANPALTIPNPGIVYRGGNTNPPENAASVSYYQIVTGVPFGGNYTLFNFYNIGSEMDIIMPYATKGYYKVNLAIYNNSASYSGGVFDAFYGGIKLRRFMSQNDAGDNVPAANLVTSLGIINVPVSGSVKLTFVCVDKSRGFGNPYFTLSGVILVPVDAP